MKIWNYIALVILIVLALSLSPAEAGSLRLGIMPSSTHWDSSKDYNERHDGVFLELGLPYDGAWAGFMKYDNSFNRNTKLGYYLQDFPINDRVSWGYMIGAATGYNEDRPILFSAFTFTISFGPVAQRTVIIPFAVNGYQAYVEF